MKRWTVGVLVACMLVISLCAAIVYVVDPFEIYRKATGYRPIIAYDTQVYSNAGIAKSYAYDSAIVGTSMMENTRPSRCDRLFGGEWIKLVTSSGTARNHAILLNTALQRHELRRVIYGLDMFSFMFSAGEVAQVFFPYYLYDENVLNDVYYLLNKDVLLDRLTELYKINVIETAPDGDVDERDAMYAWQHGAQAYCRANALAQIHFDAPVRDMDDAETYAKNVYNNLKGNLLPFIENHPDTEFIFYFPPYCVLEWYSMYQRGYLDAMMWIKETLAETLLPYPNVQLYDYQAREEWVLDLDLYLDRQHHSPAVSDAILELLARGEGRTQDLYEIYEANDTLYGWVEEIIEAGEQASVLSPRAGLKEDEKV